METIACEALVALGSNVDPPQHLSRAARALRQRFTDLRFSSCYCNPSFGFAGPDFVNAVAAFSTALPLEALLRSLREIEQESGRGPADPKWGPRAIDLDLLLYGEMVGSGPGFTLPRPDLTERVYMLGPLAEIAPQRRLPPAGPTFAELWRRYPRAEHRLERVEIDLNAL